LEGSQHSDRNQQFEYINRKAQRYLKQGEPVISVDTKKKELVGDFKNPGREWHPQGRPEPVRVHDFEIRPPENGKVTPYGVTTWVAVGWLSVGVDHDTAVCGREHTLLVALDGSPQLFQSEASADYRRFGR